MCRITLFFVTLLALSALAFAQTEAPPAAPPGSAPAATPTAPPGERPIAELLEEARNLRTQKQYGRALDVIHAILARDAVNIEAKLLGGETAIEGNAYDDARTLFLDVTRQEPSNFRANFGLGKIYVANRSWRNATKYLESAEKVAPAADTGDVKRLLALALRGAGDRTKALAKAAEAVNLNRESIDALATMIDLQVDAGQLELALRDSDALLQLCVSAARREGAKKADVAKIDQAYAIQIQILSRLKSRLFEADARGAPTDQVVAGRERDAAALMFRWSEALRGQAEVRTTLQFYDAIELASAAIRYDPENVNFVLHLARLYRDIGSEAAASETYRRVLTLDANNEEAKRFLERTGAPASQPSGPTPPLQP